MVLTEEHLNAFKTSSIGRMLIAYRNTEAGQPGGRNVDRTAQSGRP